LAGEGGAPLLARTQLAGRPGQPGWATGHRAQHLPAPRPARCLL